MIGGPQKQKAMTIQINYHRDKPKRVRASCEVDGTAYLTIGDPAIYRTLTLLSIDGHDGKPFEAHDSGGVFLTGSISDWRGKYSRSRGGKALDPRHPIKNHALPVGRSRQEEQFASEGTQDTREGFSGLSGLGLRG